MDCLVVRKRPAILDIRISDWEAKTVEIVLQELGRCRLAIPRRMRSSAPGCMFGAKSGVQICQPPSRESLSPGAAWK
jgi:hypothetical protein